MPPTPEATTPEAAIIFAFAGVCFVAALQGLGLLQLLQGVLTRLGLTSDDTLAEGPGDRLLSRLGTGRIAEQVEALGCRALGLRLDQHALVDAGKSETFVDPLGESILSLTRPGLFRWQLRLVSVFRDGRWIQTVARPGERDVPALLESHREALAGARRVGREVLPLTDRASVLRALAQRSRHPLTRRVGAEERRSLALTSLAGAGL